ncbi:MAG: hypothetical protein H6754_07460 [Candidatus Omnitrophica bacterium]|nr:hypothetical protein [Candidatus Omnitrophota bacterium]
MKSLKGKRVLITSGPTWIAIDPMRVISNRASGELGHKLATKLHQAGAKVTLLQGQVNKRLDAKDIHVKEFSFYHELAALLKNELKKKYDVVIHNAAVSDYELKTPFKAKLGSHKKTLTLKLVATAKLITTIKRFAPKSFLVGFKLEDFKNTKQIITEVQKLISGSKCDLVVANTLKGGYKAYLVNPEKKILNISHSRSELTKKLIKTIRKLL